MIEVVLDEENIGRTGGHKKKEVIWGGGAPKVNERSIGRTTVAADERRGEQRTEWRPWR